MSEQHVTFGADGPAFISRDEFAEHWPYRAKSPAWYAARHAHNIGCLSVERWADKPELYAWLKELVSILHQFDVVEQYRKELLTAEELAAVRREQADIEQNGW